MTFLIGYSFLCEVSSLPPVSQLFASSLRNHLKMSAVKRVFPAVHSVWDILNIVVKLPKSHHVVCGASRRSFSVEAQKRAMETGVSVERLTSGAVIADARCNLSISSLFTSVFSFLIYLKCYLSNNEVRKEKKNELVVSLHYGLCQVFWGKKCFIVLLCRKKEIVVCRNYPKSFCFVSFCFFAFSDKRFSVVYCPERSQSQCISVDPVSVMYVCLTTLGNLSPDGI